MGCRRGVETCCLRLGKLSEATVIETRWVETRMTIALDRMPELKHLNRSVESASSSVQAIIYPSSIVRTSMQSVVELRAYAKLRCGHFSYEVLYKWTHCVINYGTVTHVSTCPTYRRNLHVKGSNGAWLQRQWNKVKCLGGGNFCQNRAGHWGYSLQALWRYHLPIVVKSGWATPNCTYGQMGCCQDDLTKTSDLVVSSPI